MAAKKCIRTFQSTINLSEKTKNTTNQNTFTIR